VLTIVTHSCGIDIGKFLKGKQLAVSGEQIQLRGTANCQLLIAAKGNASQEVLLLRGWLNSWPMRSIVSQTVSVSSFLLSSWLPLEGSSVNDFPLQNFATTGPDLQKATQVVVRVASITQDIAAG
jgi:hypothetical protein